MTTSTAAATLSAPALTRAAPRPEVGTGSWLPFVYGLVHALVDATSVMVVYAALPMHDLRLWHAFYFVVAYDVLAFATQVVFGAAADALRAPKLAAGVGAALVAAGALALPVAALPTLLCVGLGNACFHVGAGAISLRIAPRRAAPAGVFVAPGALGLAVGAWLGKHTLAPSWPFAAALLLALVVVWRLPSAPLPHDLLEDAQLGRELRRPEATPSKPALLVLLLLASVFVRSFIGFAGSYRCPKAAFIPFALAGAAFTGKLVGGYLADRLGWLETGVGALLLSAPLIAFGAESWPVVVAGMLLFQMTMPVTLAAAALVFPRRPALAFGLTCLALILGALPTFYPWARPYYGPVTFLVLIVASAATLGGGIHLLGGRGPRPRR